MQKTINTSKVVKIGLNHNKETESREYDKAQELAVAKNNKSSTREDVVTKSKSKTNNKKKENKNRTLRLNMSNPDLMTQILSRDNLIRAYKKVKANKGSPGIDGVTVDEIKEYIKHNWDNIKSKIQKGKYKPKPVKRVEIPKPGNRKEKRMLGIPAVIDRIIQQAVLQVLSPMFEQKFSDYSFGYRPKRGCHQAIFKAKEFINQGYVYVVDMDLRKFFDKVNHDKLMALLAKDIKDKVLLKLLRSYLQADIMVEGVKTRVEEGTPQGGNLSPLFANIILDQLDKELERRGHKFCRYADDLCIYVKSKRAGDRVLKSITAYIESKLKLEVNKDKSGTDLARKRQFLGFSFYKKKGGVMSITIPKDVKKRIYDKIKYLTRRSNGKSMNSRIYKINEYFKGLINYFRIADVSSFFIELEERTRRRLRMCYWKQWKKCRTKIRNLKRLGLNHNSAMKFGFTRKGYWRISGSPILGTTLTNKYFKELGLKSPSSVFKQLCLL